MSFQTRKLSGPSIDSYTTTTCKAQKGSKTLLKWSKQLRSDDERRSYGFGMT